MATVNFIPCERQCVSSMKNTLEYVVQDIKVCIDCEKHNVDHVYFSNEMASLLREYEIQCREHLAFYESRELTADSYLFLQQNSDLPMTPSTFTARFKKILKANGLPEKLNVHSLRHTNASLMIANGVDVTTAAGLLGHAQPSTTLDIYSHAFDKNKKKAHEELQRELGV